MSGCGWKTIEGREYRTFASGGAGGVGRVPRRTLCRHGVAGPWGEVVQIDKAAGADDDSGPSTGNGRADNGLLQLGEGRLLRRGRVARRPGKSRPAGDGQDGRAVSCQPTAGRLG